MSKTCKCGYDIKNPKVQHKSKYSKFGWFLFAILGLSAKPKKVSFVCSVCNEVIEESTDPKILKEYIGR
jgi:hypothetical protein